MRLICYPEIKTESSLHLYVTGVGVSDTEPSCFRGSQRLFIIAEGCAKVTIGDKVYELDKGSVCWLGNNDSCVPEMSTVYTRIHWVTFAAPVPLPDVLFTSAEYAVFRASDFSAAATLFRGIYDALAVDQMYGGFTASALLYQLIIRLNRDAAAIPEAGEKINPAIAAALDYISVNYTKQISLEILCDAAGGLSEQYLCRLFKQTTGMRPMEYILKKRIASARLYLENTDMPIPEIVQITGFNNTSYFYRNFKKFTGMSPLACRQNTFLKHKDEK